MPSLTTMQPSFKIPPPEVRAAMDKRARQHEQEQLFNEARARMERMHIPKRFRNADLSRCPEEVQQWVLDTAQGDVHDLILTGKAGRGKTDAACACLIELGKRMRGLFATADDILREIRDTYGTYEREQDVINHYANVPLLLIDDLGKTVPTKTVMQLLFDIIDKRYRDIRPTIYTTQYDGKGLLQRLILPDDQDTAVAIMSRFKDAVSVAFLGEDRRGQ